MPKKQKQSNKKTSKLSRPPKPLSATARRKALKKIDAKRAMRRKNEARSKGRTVTTNVSSKMKNVTKVPTKKYKKKK